MFTWLSIFYIFLLLLFFSSVPLVLSEKVSCIGDCGRLGSFIDCSGRQWTNVSDELPSWADKLYVTFFDIFFLLNFEHAFPDIS